MTRSGGRSTQGGAGGAPGASPPCPPVNLQLHGLDRLVYFAPTIFFGYLAAMCAALTLIALLFAFFKH